MKRITFILIVIVLFLNACDSANVKDAKKAYKTEDYVTVINLLEKEETLDEECKNIYGLSKAYVAYDNQEYYEAIKFLLSTSDGKESEIYSKSIQALVELSISEMEFANLIDIIEKDKDVGDIVVSKITEKCDSYDYEGFVSLDKFVLQLEDSELKKQFTEYAENNKIKRAKAFLRGKWEWQFETGTKTIVNNIIYEDNMLATVEIVGDNEKKYKILQGDAYWKDFVFIDECNFTCVNLCKNAYGSVAECLTTGKIEYEKNSIQLHLTAPQPYIMINPDRTWVKIESKD